MVQYTSCKILGGRSESTESFVRLRMNGMTCKSEAIGKGGRWAQVEHQCPLHMPFHYLLVEFIHTQQACLCLFASSFAGLCNLQCFPKSPIERPLISQETRHQKVEQSPEILNIVLDGGAAQYEPVLRSNLFDSLHFE